MAGGNRGIAAEAGAGSTERQAVGIRVAHIRRGPVGYIGKRRVPITGLGRRALAQQPQILLLDEPTNHLDIKYQLQTLFIVKSLGIGVLAVLHDLNLAAMHCHKLYVLKDGMLAASGPPEQVLTPQLIRDVYEIDCDIRKNPDTGCLSISYFHNNPFSAGDDHSCKRQRAFYWRLLLL